MLTHSLIRDVLIERAPGAQRRRLHLRIAEVLERRGAEPAVLARHFRAARAREQALRYTVEAGRAATAAHGHEQAAELFDQAVALRDDADPRLLLELGDARLRASQPRCVETFGAAADLARATGDVEALAEAALGLAGRFTAPTDTAPPELEEALAGLGESELRVRVLARLAESAPESRALELSAEALALADAPRARIAALGARHAALLDIDHLDERAAVGREWVALADRHGELEAAALARHWHQFDLVELGEHAAARRELAVLEELAGRLHQPLYAYLVLVWQTIWAQIDGEPAEALSEQALAVAERMRAPDAAERHAERLAAIRGTLQPGALSRGATRFANLVLRGDDSPYAGRFALLPFAGPVASSPASRS